MIAMDAISSAASGIASLHSATPPAAFQVVEPAEFSMLMVSHRRMVRADRAADRVKGLRDLDTGEVFFVEECQLLQR